MKEKAGYKTLNQLVDFLKAQGIRVIFDAKIKEGGKCRLYDKKYIILPNTISKKAKEKSLIMEIKNLNLKDLPEELEKQIKKYQGV